MTAALIRSLRESGWATPSTMHRVQGTIYAANGLQAVRITRGYPCEGLVRIHLYTAPGVDPSEITLTASEIEQHPEGIAVGLTLVLILDVPLRAALRVHGADRYFWSTRALRTHPECIDPGWLARHAPWALIRN